MPRLTKIYTRSGDDGTTSLGTRRRVTKNAIRVASYGDVDELNSVIGLALATGLNPKLSEHLIRVQNELFNIGADLAFPEDERDGLLLPQVETRHIEALENLIDELSDLVGPLENFVLPGGTSGAAYLHLARTVCRRAERSAVALSQEEKIGDNVMTYLNRLSDALFVMARFENHWHGQAETLWNSRL
jgi:cob(I)alamin adenosyltransferase